MNYLVELKNGRLERQPWYWVVLNPEKMKRVLVPTNRLGDFRWVNPPETVLTYQTCFGGVCLMAAPPTDNTPAARLGELYIAPGELEQWGLIQSREGMPRVVTGPLHAWSNDIDSEDIIWVDSNPFPNENEPWGGLVPAHAYTARRAVVATSREVASLTYDRALAPYGGYGLGQELHFLVPLMTRGFVIYSTFLSGAASLTVEVAMQRATNNNDNKREEKTDY